MAYQGAKPEQERRRLVEKFVRVACCASNVHHYGSNKQCSMRCHHTEDAYIEGHYCCWHALAAWGLSLTKQDNSATLEG